MGLPADYDLELYNGKGEKVVASSRRGKATEEIREKLSAGRYYARVVGHKGACGRLGPGKLRPERQGTGRSERRKKKTEKVTIKPSAGRYYIRVVGHEGAWSEKLPYHLNMGKQKAG